MVRIVLKRIIPKVYTSSAGKYARSGGFINQWRCTMRRLGLTLLVATAGLLLAGDAPEDAVKKEREKLKGTWKMMSIERNGANPVSDDDREAITTTIDEDRKIKVDAVGMV